jgi:hypothetical protein
MRMPPISAALILAALAVPAHAEEPTQLDANIVKRLYCYDVVGEGWNHMPSVTDYVLSLPGADKLGYGSECHIGSLVFAQCWLEPRWSVKEAIDALLRKAATGKKLPDIPVCGA